MASFSFRSRLVYRTCLSVDTRHNGTGSRPGRNLRPIEMGDRSIFRLKNKERTFVFESLNLWTFRSKNNIPIFGSTRNHDLRHSTRQAKQKKRREKISYSRDQMLKGKCPEGLCFLKVTWWHLLIEFDSWIEICRDWRPSACGWCDGRRHSFGLSVFCPSPLERPATTASFQPAGQDHF